MAHFEHGAIDKETTKLIDPKYAAKRVKYECPDCKRDVFVRKGKKRAIHFAHVKDLERPCTYFKRNPSLDQQHKNAQLKLKEFINNKIEIDIQRRCICGCGYITGTVIPASHIWEGKTEYKFTFNDSRKSADVALVFGNEIEAIFEVVHTHYTRERDRPDPWFEINAKQVNALASDLKKITLTCLRQLRSPECLKAEEVRNERLAKEERKRMERMTEEQRLNAQRDKDFREWCKMEDEKIQLKIAKEREEYRIQAAKKAEERKIQDAKEAEERKIQAEFNAENTRRFKEENQKKLAEELRKKEHFHNLLKQASKSKSPCMNCSPFIKWKKTLEEVEWDWCRCDTCKKTIRETAKHMV
jgi:Competence protein CoiA-like family